MNSTDIQVEADVRSGPAPDYPAAADANTAYTIGDAPHLAALDQFGLILIEQRFDEEDVLGHAELATTVHTPICLDETIASTRAAAAAVRPRRRSPDCAHRSWDRRRPLPDRLDATTTSTEWIPAP